MIIPHKLKMLCFILYCSTYFILHMFVRNPPKRLLIIVRFDTSDEVGYSGGQGVHEEIE